MKLSSNDELVEYLMSQGVIKTPSIVKAFCRVDRKIFVPDELKHRSYEDVPLPIGWGQTISQPTTVGIMLELLQATAGHKILEIGSGSGYVAALLSTIVKNQGRVVALERHQGLVVRAKINLQASHFNQLKLLNKDGSQGYLKCAPYHRIIVSAAMTHTCQGIVGQLNDNGKMVAPVGREVQDLVLIERVGDKILTKKYPGFVFVPLVGKH